MLMEGSRWCWFERNNLAAELVGTPDRVQPVQAKRGGYPSEPRGGEEAVFLESTCCGLDPVRAAAVCSELLVKGKQKKMVEVCHRPVCLQCHVQFDVAGRVF